MKRSGGVALLVLACGLLPPGAAAQDGGSPQPMTLRQAEDYALAHHPEIQGADFLARAAERGIQESRAAFLPQVVASATAVAAGNATRIAASGGLNNPTVFQRESNGLLMSQLITDFGRTSDLTASSRFQAESAAEVARAVRARVLLDVNRAFFGVMGAEALVGVADQTVKARGLLLDRVSALANARLKSGLDVSFAEVSLGAATLLRLHAQDRLDGARARLAQALGSRDRGPFSLAEEPLPPPDEEGVEGLVRAALASRPELLAARAQREAAERLADAQNAEHYPILSVIGAVGFSPYRDQRLQETYSSAGLSLLVPVFTGGRISARAQASRLRASAAGKASEDEADRIERDVRVAWLEAQTAYKAIAITAKLLESAAKALDLAESRYGLGVSSIVELSQAELQKTEAEIANTTARYDYQLRRAELAFEVGTLR